MLLIVEHRGALDSASLAGAIWQSMASGHIIHGAHHCCMYGKSLSISDFMYELPTMHEDSGMSGAVLLQSLPVTMRSQPTTLASMALPLSDAWQGN